jgi:hypothetical protein
VIDLVFLGSNVLKVFEGGWVPLALAAGLFAMAGYTAALLLEAGQLLGVGGEPEAPPARGAAREARGPRGDPGELGPVTDYGAPATPNRVAVVAVGTGSHRHARVADQRAAGLALAQAPAELEACGVRERGAHEDEIRPRTLGELERLAARACAHDLEPVLREMTLEKPARRVL